VHIVVPFVLMPGMHILNVLCFVSWMCTSGTGWVHIKCVHTVPKDVTRGYRLSAFKMGLQVTSRSHLWVHCKCDQTKLGGHIGVTWCQRSQCIPHVPTGYLGHRPQCGIRGVEQRHVLEVSVRATLPYQILSVSLNLIISRRRSGRTIAHSSSLAARSSGRCSYITKVESSAQRR
jgi:hypothetical protein